MVPHGGSNFVKLIDGGGMDVRPRNPSVVNVTESTTGVERVREFTVEGKTPHVATYLEVFPTVAGAGPAARRGGAVPVARLEVNVKVFMTVTIAFQFVTDDLAVTTTRTPADVSPDLLVRTLNFFYPDQTNIRFSKAREGPVQVDTTLLRIRGEQKDLENLRYGPEWVKLTNARESGADINVFFMPWSGTAAKAPLVMFGMDGNCVCPDGIPLHNVSLALAHMIGRLLGASVTWSGGHSHHLMHWSFEKEDAILAVDNAFISRDAANAMNGP
jgi:hypothetical protein